MVELLIQKVDVNSEKERKMKILMEEQKKLIETLKNTIKLYAPYTKFPD